MRGLLRNQRGQLVIPALFVIPTLVLFIYLIFETAMLSQEKIARQFALDTAVFVEMANYSDFLNRTAYVNGAFPSRVCYEAFTDPEGGLAVTATEEGKRSGAKEWPHLYDYLVEVGLCPYSEHCKDDPKNCKKLESQGAEDWGFKYNARPCGRGDNCTDGRTQSSPDVKPDIVLFSKATAYNHNIYMPLFEFLFQNYNVIFSLLKIVEESQIAVFTRLTGSHYFYNRAYSMNVVGEKATSASQLPRISAKMHSTATADAYIQVLAGDRYETIPVSRSNGGQPYAMPLIVMTTVGGPDFSPKQEIPPREIKQTWRPRPNYFKVDTNNVLGYQPYVKATVEVSGGNIWPGATPRYQVRIYP